MATTPFNRFAPTEETFTSQLAIKEICNIKPAEATDLSINKIKTDLAAIYADYFTIYDTNMTTLDNTLNAIRASIKKTAITGINTLSIDLDPTNSMSSLSIDIHRTELVSALRKEGFMIKPFSTAKVITINW